MSTPAVLNVSESHAYFAREARFGAFQGPFMGSSVQVRNPALAHGCAGASSGQDYWIVRLRVTVWAMGTLPAFEVAVT